MDTVQAMYKTAQVARTEADPLHQMQGVNVIRLFRIPWVSRGLRYQHDVNFELS